MITDTDEFTLFDLFSSSGIVTTDTFNQWRKKDNGIVRLLSSFVLNSASQGISVNSTTATISLKAGGVSNANLADASVTDSKIANLTISEGKLAANSVSTAKIASLAVTSDKIGAGAVIAGKLAIDAVTTSNIANLSITSDKIGAGAVIAGKLAANSVGTSNIVDLNVSTAKIASLAVTSDKIGAGAVTTSKLAANSVGTTNLINNAVTDDKIASNAVTNDKIAAASITSSKLASNVVSTEKIVSQAVTAGKLDGGQGGASPIYGARAFVNFNGSSGSTVSGEFRCNIRNSGNVEKVVRLSTGVFKIFFNVNMQDTQYTVVASAGGGDASNEGTLFAGGADSSHPRADGSCIISTATVTGGVSSGTLINPSTVNAVIFR